MDKYNKFFEDFTYDQMIDLAQDFRQVYTDYRDDITLREAKLFDLVYPGIFKKSDYSNHFVGTTTQFVGGIGYEGNVACYGDIDFLTKLQSKLPKRHEEIEFLINFWRKENLSEQVIYKLCEFPVIGKFGILEEYVEATTVEARYAGVMLDYSILLDRGIDGLIAFISAQSGDAQFKCAAISMLKTLSKVISLYKQQAKQANHLDHYQMLKNIEGGKPTNFREALQLMFLFAQMSGSENYSRVDDFIGDFLARDIVHNTYSEQQIYDIIFDMFTLMADKGNYANTRVVIGGRGRKNPNNADIFAKYAIKVIKDLKRVAPQLTLRFDQNTDQTIIDLAIDCIGSGSTFPMLYNDDINVKAVMNAMDIDEQLAEQYVPLGCGEYTLSGRGIGTPNAIHNTNKLLTIFLNDGIDAYDNVKRLGIETKPLSTYATYDHFERDFFKAYDYHLRKCAQKQS